MRVILAIDFSVYAEAAARAVEQRPWPADTEIAVVHVIPPLTVTYGWVDPSTTIELLGREAEKLVNETARRLSSRGLRAIPVVLRGYPTELVPDYAREWKADLVIAGAHGATGLVRFLLGSVARAVLRSVQCSVEIVRSVEHAPPHAAMRILLATDGSEFSDKAARAVAERRWPAGSIVRVVSILELPPIGIDAWNTVSVIEELRGDRMRLAREALERAVNILSGAGLKVEPEVFDGNAKAMIVDEAKRWDADLVVVGSHGRRGLSRLMLGSVAEAVAMHSHCSVAVIK